MKSHDLSTLHHMYGYLNRFVFQRVKDTALSEDIVQEVFLKVYSNLDQLKDSQKVNSWIMQITRNAINDHFRVQKRNRKVPYMPDESDKEGFNACAGDCLKKLLTTLPYKYRQALELVDIENLSQIEVANRLELSYSGAKTRVQRARIMLKAKFDALYETRTDTYGNIIYCVTTR